MKIRLVLLASVVCVHAAFGQHRTNREVAGFKGPVRSVRVERVVHSLDQGPDSLRVRVMTIQFDEAGNITDQIVYKSNGAIRWKYGWDYQFDINGNETEVDYRPSDGPPSIKAVNTYDRNQHLIKKTFYTSTGQINHVEALDYDGRGDVIRIDHKRGDGSVQFRRVFNFDDKRQIVEEIFDRPDGQLDHRITYAYDAQGRKIRWTLFDTNGQSVTTLAHTYDENGNVAETRHYRKDSLVLIESFKYRSDPQGNWIEREETREGIVAGNSKFSRETSYRTIEYY